MIKGSLGCYQFNITSHLEFVSSASHLDLSAIQSFSFNYPIVCADACKAVSYRYSTILYGKYCMCSTIEPVSPLWINSELCYNDNALSNMTSFIYDSIDVNLVSKSHKR